MIRDLVGASAARSSGLFFLPAGFDFGKRRQRLGGLQIVDHGEVLVEIREQQDGQIEPAALHIDLSFLQIALLLLRLDARLDHVGVGHFAAVLPVS